MTAASKSEKLGPAVRDGAVRYVSPSQIDKFDASVGGCARRWWFRYVERRPEPERAAALQGTQIHAQIEHYLKTGEDVLGEIARSGRAWIPKPGSDLLVEHEFGGARDGEIFSAISAAGVPVIGKVDVMHRRPWMISSEGTDLVYEPVTCEVIDWKSTSNIGYAKSPAAIASAWPMLAYGAVARELWPDVERVRLSHVYFATKGPRAAEKRTVSLPVVRVAEGWLRAGDIVERMKSAAGETGAASLAPNLNACGSYGGCPHREYCPRDPGQVLAAIFRKGSAMPNDTHTTPASPDKFTARPSLLQRISAQAAANAGTAGVSAPLAPSPDRTAIDAEKARLLAEESARRGTAGAVAPPDAPRPSRTYEPIPAEAPAEIRQFAPVTDAEIKAGGDRVAAELAAMVAAASPFTPATVPACPASGVQRILSFDEVAERKFACGECGVKLKIKPQKIGDKYAAIVPNHGRRAEPVAQPAPREPKVDLAAQPALPIPTEPPPARAERSGVFPLTGQAPYPVAALVAVAPVPATPAADAALKLVASAGPTPYPPGVHLDVKRAARAIALTSRLGADDTDGFDLYLDCVPDGVAVARLETYAEPIRREIEHNAHAAELRCAPADSALSFGKWKGALAAAVRAAPPASGSYVADTRGEIAAVVAEALAPMARRVVRGAR